MKLILKTSNGEIMFILIKRIKIALTEQMKLRQVSKRRKKTLKQCDEYINKHCLDYERDSASLVKSINDKIQTIKVNHGILTMNKESNFYTDHYIDNVIVATAANEVYQNLSYFQQVLLSSYYFNGHESLINYILFKIKTDLIPFFVGLNTKKR